LNRIIKEAASAAFFFVEKPQFVFLRFKDIPYEIE